MKFNVINVRYCSEPCIMTLGDLLYMCEENGWSTKLRIIEDKIYDERKELVAVLVEK